MKSRQTAEAVVNADISRVDHVPRDPERVMRLMRSYARLQGTQSNLSAIRKDLAEHEADYAYRREEDGVIVCPVSALRA